LDIQSNPEVDPVHWHHC